MDKFKQTIYLYAALKNMLPSSAGKIRYIYNKWSRTYIKKFTHVVKNFHLGSSVSR